MGATADAGPGASLGLCFNPRPPRKVGATLEPFFQSLTQIVSILAHPERWALPPTVKCFWAFDSVSILAHPERWALHAGLAWRRPNNHSFNPRPPRKVGATTTRSTSSPALTRFNPRPPRKVGATKAVTITPSLISVSILAHPERWALQRWCPLGRRGSPGFNPRPPRKVGATWRRGPDDPCIIMFQSSPTPKGGRYDRLVQPQGAPGQEFQSSPTPKGGRYAFDRQPYGASDVVSILAHPERWALLALIRPPAPSPVVSILAHPERWALQSGHQR